MTQAATPLTKIPTTQPRRCRPPRSREDPRERDRTRRQVAERVATDRAADRVFANQPIDRPGLLTNLYKPSFLLSGSNDSASVRGPMLTRQAPYWATSSVS
jgi:hypothetical protein